MNSTTEELNSIQKQALEILKENYQRTKFNCYPKVNLYLSTGIKDRELRHMHSLGYITRKNGVNKTTLIVLTDKSILT